MNFDKLIEKEKKKLIAKAKRNGLYENFGQTEVRKLRDKLNKEYHNEYSSEARPQYEKLRQFEEWSNHFDQRALLKV